LAEVQIAWHTHGEAYPTIAVRHRIFKVRSRFLLLLPCRRSGISAKGFVIDSWPKLSIILRILLLENGSKEMAIYPASVPRKMFWSGGTIGTSECPECGERLEADPHSYLMMIRGRRDVNPFIVGPKGGYFCPRCPSVVLDRDEFLRYASVVRQDDSMEFAVVGLVDMDAIPKDKRHLPLGADDNPIPLVRFTNIPDWAIPKRAAGGKLGRRLRRLKKRH